LFLSIGSFSLNGILVQKYLVLGIFTQSEEKLFTHSLDENPNAIELKVWLIIFISAFV